MLCLTTCAKPTKHERHFTYRMFAMLLLEECDRYSVMCSIYDTYTKKMEKLDVAVQNQTDMSDWSWPQDIYLSYPTENALCPLFVRFTYCLLGCVLSIHSCLSSPILPPLPYKFSISFLPSFHPLFCDDHPFPSSPTKRHRPQSANLRRVSVQWPRYLWDSSGRW